MPPWAAGVLILGLIAAVYWLGLVRRNVHIWLWGYVRRVLWLRGQQTPLETNHLLFCFVDHFEPLAGDVDEKRGEARVSVWVDHYPEMAARHYDSEGKSPIHTFFYPEEEYRPKFLRNLTGLCRAGFGEIEVHLHHDNDTGEGLREKLTRFVHELDVAHGAISRVNGEYRYAFIHGNWALDNSRRDGRWCGVNNELEILRDTGCYADFTLPSAPSDTQTSMVNSIYYAQDDPSQPKSHDKGVPLSRGYCGNGDLLIFQGPLALNWQHRKFGIWPRIENADISECDIPIEDRVDLWVRERIHVIGRPEWVFIKVHTHGAVEENAEFLFGGEFDRLFSHLERKYNDGVAWRLHYVSAREAYNIAKAAEAGLEGGPGEFRDYAIPRPTYGMTNES